MACLLIIAHAPLASALKAIAATRPASRSALAAVPGIGGARLTRFGDELLALVADH